MLRIALAPARSAIIAHRLPIPPAPSTAIRIPGATPARRRAQRDRGGFDEGCAHAVDIGPDGIEDIGRSSDELRVRTSPPDAGDAACPGTD